MHRIKPPDLEWTFKCGDRDWLTGKIVLCNACKWSEPDERPEDCPNIVTIDLKPKY